MKTTGYIIICGNRPMLWAEQEQHLVFGHKGKGTLFETRAQAKRAISQTHKYAKKLHFDWSERFGEMQIGRTVSFK
jgi:hypothetical protein